MPAGSSPSPAAAAQLPPAVRQRFLLGVLLMLSLCVAVALSQWRADGAAARAGVAQGWRAEQMRRLAHQQQPQQQAATSYSQRAVQQRLESEAAAARELSAEAETAADESSWQAALAAARLASGGSSTRTRGVRQRPWWSEQTAHSLRGAAVDVAVGRTSTLAARPHPLLSKADAESYASRTLVLYSFIATDSDARANLDFFVHTAVRAHQAADYVFIVQRNGSEPLQLDSLPSLPPNAKYVEYLGESEACGGLGPIGWLLSQQHPLVDADGRSNPAMVRAKDSPLFVAFGSYGHTMLLDSSMRGPWFPTWLDVESEGRAWFHAFQYHLERNAPDMHIVGSTISCQFGQPHVQLGAVMLDRDGWAIVDANRHSLLQCVPARNSTAAQAMALSRAMLDAGSNLGSQMLSYQEVDFRQPPPFNSTATALCLDYGGDPQYEQLSGREMSPAGHYMDPYELVFVKHTSEFRYYKSETFSEWKEVEEARWAQHRSGQRFFKQWTPTDFAKAEMEKGK